MNHVALIGRIARDIQLSKTQSGKSVISFSLAVNRDKETADFIPCIAWNQLADNMIQYCTKGSQIGVAGRIQTRSYETQDGHKRFVTEVIANRVEFLGKKQDKQELEENYTDEFDIGTSLDIDSDDLPF